jgi:hypothetical protein
MGGGTALFIKKNVTHTDPKPAIEFGQGFYDSLGKNEIKKAFALYSSDFQNSQDDTWENFLKQFNTMYGKVRSNELNGVKLLPIKGNPCFALRYNVQRNSLSTLEQIIVCPSGSEEMAIVGHGLTRLDTNQKINAGVSFTETGLKFGL